MFKYVESIFNKEIYTRDATNRIADSSRKVARHLRNSLHSNTKSDISSGCCKSHLNLICCGFMYLVASGFYKHIHIPIIVTIFVTMATHMCLATVTKSKHALKLSFNTAKLLSPTHLHATPTNFSPHISKHSHTHTHTHTHSHIIADNLAPREAY